MCDLTSALCAPVAEIRRSQSKKFSPPATSCLIGRRSHNEVPCLPGLVIRAEPTSGGGRTAMTANVAGVGVDVMVAVGPPSTPCGDDASKGVDGEPAPAMTSTGACQGGYLHGRSPKNLLCDLQISADSAIKAEFKSASAVTGAPRPLQPLNLFAIIARRPAAARDRPKAWRRVARFRTASCRRFSDQRRRSRYWCRTGPASAPAGPARRTVRSR